MTLPGFTAQRSLCTAWGTIQAGERSTFNGEGRTMTGAKGSIVPQFAHLCMAGYCLVCPSWCPTCILPGGPCRCIPDTCRRGECFCVPPPGWVIARSHV